MGRSLRVSEAGLERVKKAFQLTGWTQDYLAGSVECSRQTVGKFLAGGDVDRPIFEAICSKLNLRVADIADDESHELNDKWRLVQEIVSEPVDGRKLSGADLSGADLMGAYLSSANLSSANLSDAYLSDAYLSSAYLSSANLSDADLIGADLSRADLSGADLSGAYLGGTYLNDANLRGARINAQTKIDSKWRLVWEIVNQGARERDLTGIDLSDANLSGADLSGADLSSAYLMGANLGRAYLIGANLSRAVLMGAYLSDAYLSRAVLSDAVVENARFGGNFGLTEEMKRDLKQRGAIFEDSPGDCLWHQQS